MSELEGAIDRASDAIDAEAAEKAAAGRQEKQQTETPADPQTAGTA